MITSASPTGQIQAASAFMFRKLSAVNGRMRRWFNDENAARRNTFEPMEPRQLLSGISDIIGPGQASSASITIADGPLLQVSGNGQIIHDRDPVTSTDNLTDYGTVVQDSPPVTHVFTLTNIGTEELEILNVLGGLGFVADPTYPATLQPGESGDLSITMLTGTIRENWSPNTIYTNSQNDKNFRLSLSGTIIGAGDVEVESAGIRITGDGKAIFNGDTETTPVNLTDFGTILQYGDDVSHTFSVANSGTAQLEILNIAVPEGFTLDTDYTRFIEPGETGEFTVTLPGSDAGFFYDDVVVTSNALDNETFTFAISGEVTEIGQMVFTSTTPQANRTHIDEAGNTVVFKMTGAGVGIVHFDIDTNEILSLSVEGTKKSSAVNIDVTKTKGEGTGISAINEIIIGGPLNYLKAAKVNLDGDFYAYSGISSVALNDVAGIEQQYFFVGGATTTKTDLAFAQINDLVLDISGHISKFTALEWLDTDDTRDMLYAGSIGTFNITGRKASSGVEAIAGDMSADMEIYNTGTQTGRPSVGSFIVAGEVYESSWEIDGYTNSIKLGAAYDLDLIAEDGLGTFTVVGEADELYILAGYFLEIGIPDDDDSASDSDEDCGCEPLFVGSAINTINVGQWFGGELLADSIKTINITGIAKTSTEPALPGEMFDVYIQINGLDVADNAYALNTLNVAGEFFYSDLLVNGHVNKISVGDVDSLDFEITGKLGSFISTGLVTDTVLVVSEGAGTIQAGEWDGGYIEAETLKLLNITGKATGTSTGTLNGDLLATLYVVGPTEPTSAQTVGTIKVAGTVYGDGVAEEMEEGLHEYYISDWLIRGSVGSITAGAFQSALLSFTPYFGAKTTTKVNTFKAGTVDETFIEAMGVDFGSINTINWLDGGIEAQKIGSLTTRGQAKTATLSPIDGDFTANLTVGTELSVDTKAVGNVLSTMSIAGSFSDSVTNIFGNVGNVTVGDMFFSGFSAKGNITSFTAKTDIEESLIYAEKKLTTLRATNILVSTVSASTIGTINVTKNLTADIKASGVGVPLTTPGIGSLIVGGWIEDSFISTKGNVTSVRAASFVDSSLFLGVNSEAPVGQLPTSRLDFSNPAAVLGSFMITGAGVATNAPSFINSRVAAGVLNNVNIKLVGSLLDDEETLTGFSAATKIGSYRRLSLVDSKLQPVVVTNKTVPGTYDTNGINYVLIVADLLDEAAG